MPSVADLVEESRLRELVGDEATLSRGRELASEGAAEFREFGPVRVVATVRDDRVQTVLMTSGPEGLGWSCSCGAERFCVHATAAAIETWRRSPKRRSRGKGRT